jgi:hypothetical protein
MDVLYNAISVIGFPFGAILGIIVRLLKPDFFEGEGFTGLVKFHSLCFWCGIVIMIVMIVGIIFGIVNR